MSLQQLWATLKAARWTILLMVLVATGIAAWVATGLPKQYTAMARVMLNVDNTDPNQFSALKRDTSAGYINTQIKLVTEGATLKAVVAKLGWADNPQVVAAWTAETGGVGDPATWAAAQLRKTVNVAPLEDSSIIQIYYTTSSLDGAKQIVALIRQAYIDESQRLRAEAAQRAADWNARQAALALADLRRAQAARIAFLQTNQIPLDTPQGGLDYTAQLQTMNGTATTGIVASKIAEAPEDPTVTRLRTRLNALDAEIAVLRQSVGEADPAMIAAMAERDTVARQLENEQTVSRAGPSATDAQIGVVRQQRDNEYLAARLRLIDRAPLYDKLAAIDRDLAMRTKRYTTVATHAQVFDTIAAAPSGLNVMGDVIADDDPSFPNIPLMLGVAAGSSLLLAVAVTLVRELIRRQVRAAEDLRFFAKVPVLAVIAPDPPPRGRWRAWLARRWHGIARLRPRRRGGQPAIARRVVDMPA